MIGVGLIGARWGASAHVPAIQASPDFRLAAVATSRMETATAAAREFGAPAAYDDPFALASDPAVDVVVVCVRVPEHQRLVAAALKAGKHVYCEWPLARDVAEAEAMVAAAKAAGVVNLVGLQSRVVPALMQLKALVGGGAIGKVISASLEISGVWPIAVPADIEYLQKAESGGNWFTIAGGHAIDVFCDILGPFASLSASAATRWPEVTIVDEGRTTARTAPDAFAVSGVLEGGAFANFVVRGSPASGFGLRFEVSGETGGLLVTAPGPNPMIQMSDLTLSQVAADGALTPLAIPPECILADPAVGWHAIGVAQTYARLAAAIKNGAPVPADFAAGLANHRLLERVMRSAREGLRV